MNTEVGALREPLQLRFELGERVPVAGHEQQHGELGPEVGHAAFADVAAAFADDARQLVNHAGAVATDGRNGQVLLHLRGGVWGIHCACGSVSPGPTTVATAAVSAN